MHEKNNSEKTFVQDVSLEIEALVFSATEDFANAFKKRLLFRLKSLEEISISIDKIERIIKEI
jgi:hypothetical protein